jgi:perosamine synthetase
MERIPVAGPWITEKEIAYVTDAASNAWYGNANMYHERFERAFAAYVGRKHAIAVAHCTGAIHLALAALGIGPGDEVIVPETTWIATSAPITYVGATPVFADVDPDTWCLSAVSFESAVTDRTKAVIPVDLYGGVPDWDAILAIAARRGIRVIEDAAQAIGGEYRKRKTGSFGDASVFSFHGSKTLTTGEGGMVATDSDELWERILCLRDHGRIVGERMFWNGEVAYKYKMSSMQAALGLAQLERIEELIARKRQAFGWYKERLGNLAELRLNMEPPSTRNTYWMNTAIPPLELGVSKEDMVKQLRSCGIDARPVFYPLSSLPAYEALGKRRISSCGENKVAYLISGTGVNLPSHLLITEEQVDRVCHAVRDILRLK